MINDELINIWKSSTNIEQVKFKKSRIMLEIQSSIDSFNKTVKYRDLREIMAAIIIIPIFGYYLFTLPSLISKLASGLFIVWAIYVVFRLLKTRKLKPSEFSENYLSYLRKSKEYFLAQKQLLDSVFWWYIAPFIFCTVLFVIGRPAIPGNNNETIQTIVGAVILSVIIYIINKRYAKKEFKPRIQKIEALIRTMEETE